METLTSTPTIEQCVELIGSGIATGNLAFILAVLLSGGVFAAKVYVDRKKKQ